MHDSTNAEQLPQTEPCGGRFTFRILVQISCQVASARTPVDTTEMICERVLADADNVYSKSVSCLFFSLTLIRRQSLPV